jgi:MSHA biogenesis protein MshI
LTTVIASLTLILGTLTWHPNMAFFRKSKKTDGWRALSFRGGEIRAVHVGQLTSAKPVVSLALTVPLARSAVPAVLEQLAKQWQSEQFQCTTLVGGREYQFLPVEAPNVPATELKSAVSWLVKDMLDFPVDQATIDILTVPQEKNAPQRSRAMYAVATQTKVVGEYQRWFEAAKLQLKVIDIPEMAQRNTAALLEEDGRGIALVSFDIDGGLLTFTFGGELYLSRRIDVTLAQLLESEPAQCETHHERIALEIQRSLDHFGRQFHSIALAKLVIAPLGIDDGGLVAYLSKNLDTKVEALNLETIFDFSRVPELKKPASQQKYFMTLGAALRVEEKSL